MRGFAAPLRAARKVYRIDSVKVERIPWIEFSTPMIRLRHGNSAREQKFRESRPPVWGIPIVSTDSEIIGRSEQRPQAFGEVFDRHAVVVESFLRRRLGRDAAEDCLSETFLIAFRRRRSFDREWTSARPWLLGIAARVAAKHRATEAKHWRAVQASASRGEHTTGGGLDDADGRVDARAAIQLLAPRIAALSAKDRDTFLLHAWADLSHEEIAQALRIPVGTVGSRLHRIRRKLAPPGATTTRLSWMGKEIDNGTVRTRA